MKKVLTLICLVILLHESSCKSGEHKEEEETHFVVTSPLERDTAIVNNYVCQIKSIRNIEVRTQEKGYLQNIYVDEGQFVKKGQLLFRIMPRLYEAELSRAQAEVSAAEIEVQNTTPLVDNNVVSKNELALAQAKLAKAKAEAQLAKVHLDFTEIRAPFDGLINRLNVKLGSLVDEGELLTTLSDNSEMWVYFNVSEAEYLNFKTAQSDNKKIPVNLLMANNEVFKYGGLVETIEGEFNNETGNIAFRATFPNPEKLLRHGETGNILLKEDFRNALIIPQKATMEVMDKKYVYVVNKEDKVELRPITVVAELPDLFIVSGGLSVSEKILLEGLRKVQNNDKITYEFEKPETVIAHLSLPTE